MTAKNPPKPEEPFLNVVARKLGRAAGALTNVAQGLSENLTALPQTVSTQLGAAKAEPRVRHRTAGKTAKKKNRAATKRRVPTRARKAPAKKSQRVAKADARRKNN
jgi:hypothetical protein